MVKANVIAKVKVDKTILEPFHSNKGLCQGDGLTCLLFNIIFQIEEAASNLKLHVSEAKSKHMVASSAAQTARRRNIVTNITSKSSKISAI